MKNWTILSVALILLLHACQKEEISQPTPDCVPMENITSQDSSFYIYYSGSQEYGSATAIKINQPWEASAVAEIRNDLLFLTFSTFISENYPRHLVEKIYLDSFPLTEGCYEIRSSPNSLSSNIYAAYDADVLEDRYFTDDTQPNYLQIDSLDLEDRKVSGEFMVSYFRDTTKVGRVYNPEQVRFFNGSFECEIIE